MKTIGLLGGMSYVSTLEYYKLIHQTYTQFRGQHHSPHLILVSVDFYQIATAMHQARWDIIETILTQAARTLKAAGATFAVICCNSAHKVFPALQQNVPHLPILHILDAVGQRLTRYGIQRVGIIGTTFVMADPFYAVYLRQQFDIDSVIPDANDQAMIQRIIYQELCLGQVNPDTRCALRHIIETLITKGAEGIILGCTELLLAVSQEDYGIPIIDSTTLHAKMTAEYAMAQSPHPVLSEVL